MGVMVLALVDLAFLRFSVSDQGFSLWGTAGSLSILGVHLGICDNCICNVGTTQLPRN